MPGANPFIAGRHISEFNRGGGGNASPNAPAAEPQQSSLPASAGGPSHAMPMIMILIIALVILLIATHGLGIRLLGSVSGSIR